MPIIAKEERTFVPAPEGQFNAVCCDVVDLGLVETEWQGKKKSQHKARIVFQIEEMMEDGKPFTVGERFTVSLAETSRLRPFLESWRGREFTPEELVGFDLEKLIGAPAFIQVAHVMRANKVYANIQTIMKAPKGSARLEIRDYVRVKDREQPPNGNGTPVESEDEDEGVPF